ncbi:hypothetical protein [Microbacterium sp.]|uniref:hypothetical protein n=1 Tax=Microbacterium sp. TaxID=51671 RepID=UPI003F9CB150
MVQFWTPLRELTPSLRPGEWLMADKSRRIGFIQHDPQTRSYRCLTPESSPGDRIRLGSAPTLPEAAQRLWEWGRRSPLGWRPSHDLVEVCSGIWVMPPRPGHDYPQGFIEEQTRGDEKRFEASSGGTAHHPRELIGHYPTFDTAARAVWEFPIKG